MTSSVTPIEDGKVIKKVFQPIVDLLQANKNAKVSVVLDQVIELASAAISGQTPSTVAKNDKGEVVALRCGYFKKWMPVSHVEFGHKTGSASGYANACKEGLSNWHKQQRAFQNGTKDLFAQVLAGTLLPSDAAEKVKQLELERDTIIPKSDGIGFDTAEEAVRATKDELDAIVAKTKEQNEAAAQALADTPATEGEQASQSPIEGVHQEQPNL